MVVDVSCGWVFCGHLRVNNELKKPHQTSKTFNESSVIPLNEWPK